MEDSLFGFVRFADGTSLNLQTSFAINRAEKDVRSVKLYGSCQGADLFPLRVFGEENGQLYDKDYPFMEMRDWHLDLDRNFVKACLGEESLLVTARQGTYIQELICMLYQSASRCDCQIPSRDMTGSPESRSCLGKGFDSRTVRRGN